jgi:hypothetical protein
VEQLAKLLNETGSFSSTEQSIGFVRAVGLQEIEAIIQLSLRLESAFKTEITSSDMVLLFEAPDTPFNDASMTDEFGSDSSSPPGSRDRVAGTTEVGVAKTTSGQAGKGRHTKVLLKSKVVLERDIV